MAERERLQFQDVSLFLRCEVGKRATDVLLIGRRTERSLEKKRGSGKSTGTDSIRERKADDQTVSLLVTSFLHQTAAAAAKPPQKRSPFPLLKVLPPPLLFFALRPPPPQSGPPSPLPRTGPLSFPISRPPSPSRWEPCTVVCVQPWPWRMKRGRGRKRQRDHRPPARRPPDSP